MLKKIIFATALIMLFIAKHPVDTKAEIVEINGKTYDTSNRQTDPEVEPTSPYVKWWAVYEGITWSVFDDKVMIMEGDGSGHARPVYDIGDYRPSTGIWALEGLCKNNGLEGNFTYLGTGAFRKYFPDYTDIEYIYCDCVLYDNCESLFRSLIKTNYFTCGDNFSSSNVTNMSSMFDNFASDSNMGANDFDLSKFNTSSVSNMYGMFANMGYSARSSLDEGRVLLDLTSFDTSNVVTMSHMFNDTFLLKEIDLSSFNTANVTTMEYMFGACEYGTSYEGNVEKIIFGEHFDTSNVENMKGMFQDCHLLTTIETVIPFDTSSVITMESMFGAECDGCLLLTDEAIQALGIENWDVSHVENFSDFLGGPSHLQHGCESLTSLDLSRWNTESAKNMGSMFYGCSGLTSLIVPFNTSRVTNMSRMFYRCTSLPTLDVTSFDTSQVTTMSYMFGYCQSLTPTINVSGFNTSSVKYFSGMFCSCENMTTLDVTNFVTTSATDMSYMFSSCSSLPSLDVTNFNTSNVTNMEAMFAGCSSISPTINVSNFNTTKVTNMASMFSRCSSFSTLNLDNFDTSSVTTMRAMFSGCSGLPGLNINHFNTGNVTNMSYMLSGLSFSTIDISNFNTSKVQNMAGMFSSSKFKSLDLSNFNTSSVVGNPNHSTWNTPDFTGFEDMFYNCDKLETLNVSSFTTVQCGNMKSMFQNCTSLKELDLSNFDFSGLQKASSTSYSDGNSSILYNCIPYILKLPKKTGTQLPVKLGYFFSPSSYPYTNLYDYYAETGTNPRFENTKWGEEIPVNFNLDTSPTKVLYRKFQIQYKKPLSEVTSALDPIMQQEYICPYEGYPNATSPEPISDRVITWKKSTTFPDCPYESYTIGDTDEPFALTTNFATDLEETKDNYILTLRGAPVSGFRVQLGTVNLGSHKNTDFSKVHKIKVDLKADNDYYWVSVTPSLTSGKMTISDGRGHTYNMNVTMPKQKIYYSEVKNNPDVGNGYHQGELEITISGDILYPGNYTGTLDFDINSGTD